MRTKVGLLGTTLGAVAIGISSIVAFGATAQAGDPAPDTTVDTTSETTIPDEPTTTFFDEFGRPIDIDGLNPGSRPGPTFQTQDFPPPPTTLPPPTTINPTALPANSGSGRRVVYSKSLQRLWVIDGNAVLIKTHRVSGKLKWCDPKVGTYSVYSRSRYTNSIQNPSIKWGYMVRFAKGCNGGNIGFHEIPSQYGKKVQTIAQLGTPLSGGCVRQAESDAIWMWNWAGIGTKVVVLA